MNLNPCRWFVYKLFIANLTTKSAGTSIGSDRNIGSEAMEEEIVMVAEGRDDGHRFFGV